jgi:hypothetical protein
MSYQERGLGGRQFGRSNGVGPRSDEHAGMGVGTPGKRTLTEQLPAPRTQQPYGGVPASAGAAVDVPPPEGSMLVEQLGSFEEIVASAPGQAVPGDVRTRFEAAHRVDLSAVRVHVTSALGDHDIRGLSRGSQIALADLGDRDALEHELGHVVDALGAGGAPPNATLDGMPLADDAAREARADELAAKAKAPPPPGHAPGKLALAELAPGQVRQPRSDVGGAPMPKLTNRANITRTGNFSWAPHKTRATPVFGGGYGAEGLGAVLSSTTKLAHQATTLHGQLETLKLEIPPQYVDDSRPPLGDPPMHYAGHRGAYVLPSALLGLALPNNLLYLPPAALGELANIQRDMIDLAKKGPGRLQVTTTFGLDHLANGVTLAYEALDRSTAATVFTITWAPPLPADRLQWGAAPVLPATHTGTAPTTAEWKTQIRWAQEHSPSGDGVHVIADKLGPDHPLGSAPSDPTAAKRVDTLFAAAGRSEPYIAGHLLNDHLGGPGNLSANLAPIPKTANSQMSESIEKPAKKIVNEQRGWIRYEVRVTHKNDKGLDYPAQIDADMGVYDATGTLQNQTSSKIAISRPSSYANGKQRRPVAQGQLGGAALQDSPQMLDEVVLSHENDLRPFLRDSAGLFELVIGSELNANIQNPEFAEAWRKVQEHLHEIEAIMLPDLNILSTVTEALVVWERDPIAQQYLTTKSVSQLKQSVKKALLAGEIFAQNAMGYLTKANVVVKKEISPSDLFRDQRLLELARELIREAPDDRTLLQLVQARQAQTLPLHHDQLRKARESGNVAMETEESNFRDVYKQQAQPTHTDYPRSPGAFFEEFETSVHDVTRTAMYGATFESVRGPKAIKKLHELALAGETSTLFALLADPLLGSSKRIQAMVGQLRRFMIDRIWTESVNMPLELEKYFAANEVLWLDSLEMLGMKEPKVALRLYTLLGIT